LEYVSAYRCVCHVDSLYPVPASFGRNEVIVLCSLARTLPGCRWPRRPAGIESLSPSKPRVINRLRPSIPAPVLPAEHGSPGVLYFPHGVRGIRLWTMLAAELRGFAS